MAFDNCSYPQRRGGHRRPAMALYASERACGGRSTPCGYGDMVRMAQGGRRRVAWCDGGQRGVR